MSNPHIAPFSAPATARRRKRRRQARRSQSRERHQAAAEREGNRPRARSVTRTEIPIPAKSAAGSAAKRTEETTRNQKNASVPIVATSTGRSAPHLREWANASKIAAPVTGGSRPAMTATSATRRIMAAHGLELEHRGATSASRLSAGSLPQAV